LDKRRKHITFICRFHRRQCRAARKKTRLCENSEVDECLYKWFLKKHRAIVPINGVILKAKAIQFNKLLGGHETFIFSNGWLWRWKVRHGICQFNVEGESASGDSATAAQFPEALYCRWWVH
jgi:hypothetical protein